MTVDQCWLQDQGDRGRHPAGRPDPHVWTLQLAVGAINEQIEVKASTGPADRSSAEASTVIDTEQIAESSQQRTRLGQLHAARAVCAG